MASERPDQASRELVPDWLAQAASLGWRLLVVVALGAVVLRFAAILGTVVAAIVLAVAVTAAVDPYTSRLLARGRSANAAAAILTLLTGAVGIAVILVAGIALVPPLADLARALESALAALRDGAASLGMAPAAASIASEVAADVSTWLSDAGAALISNVAGTATVLLLAFFLLFFMLTDLDRSVEWVLQAASPEARASIRERTITARSRLGRSLRDTTTQALVAGGATLLVAAALGLQSPLALAVIVIGGAYIPLVGPIAATALVGLIAFGAAGAGAGLALVATQVAVTLLAPRILGERRWRGHGMHPMVVLVAISIGAIVGGALGMVLSVPVVLVIVEVGPAVIAALDGGDAADEGSGIVPRWLDRLAQWSIRLLVLAAIAAAAVVALGEFPLIVGPVILAAVAAATMAPAARALTRRGLSVTTAALVVTVGGFGLILGIVVLAVGALAEPIDDIVANATAGAGSIDQLIASTGTLTSITASVGDELVPAVAAVVVGIAAIGILVALGAILTFYLLRDGRRGFEFATATLTSWRRDGLARAAERATTVLGGYMIGTGVVSAVGALSQLLLMALLGIPLAAPLAVLSFFGGFIPYIGTFLTTGLAFLVTVALGSSQDALIMLIYTLVINIVQGNIVAPLVYGKAVSIHPAVVLLAIPAGSAIAGIVGMFLAVPVVGVLATTWRIVLHVFASEPDDAADAGDPAGVEPSPLPAAVAEAGA